MSDIGNIAPGGFAMTWWLGLLVATVLVLLFVSVILRLRELGAALNTDLSWAGYSRSANWRSDTDADGDGFSDRDEVLVYDTDPYLPDSDGDGLADADEVAAGTDPRNVYSFHRQVTVETSTSDNLAGVTNYVAWGTSAT